MTAVTTASRPTAPYRAGRPAVSLYGVTFHSRGHRYTLPIADTTPATAALAREFVRRHAPANVADAVELAASELIGNVARHAPGPARLALTICGERVTVSVSDEHPEIPVRIPAPGTPWDLDAESGRGLLLLAAMAEIRVRRAAGRKRVTARIQNGDPS